MKYVLTIVAIIATLSISGLAAADCPADLDGSGDVGFSDLTAVLGAWGLCPGCAADLDSSGDVGFSDLTTVLGAWGLCPDIECRADMPEFFDPSGTELEWMANATCAELHAESGDGVPACSQAESGEMLTDINWILANYPFTGAVLDAQSGGYQTYIHTPSALMCGTGEVGVYFPDGFFDELAACWHGGNTAGSLLVNFDWNVNYYEAHDAYEALVLETYPGGFCEIDNPIGAPTGFHAEDQGDGWKYWTVHSTETCDYDGCRCDATVTLWSNGTDHFVDQVTNESSNCEDPRFDF